jgi:Flp pilus assembly protein TadD
MRELGTPAAAADPSVEELAQAFTRAGQAGASSPQAMTLARSLVASQQYLLAIPVLDRALRAKPDNVEAKSLLGETYRGLGCAALAK